MKLNSLKNLVGLLLFGLMFFSCFSNEKRQTEVTKLIDGYRYKYTLTSSIFLIRVEISEKIFELNVLKHEGACFKTFGFKDDMIECTQKAKQVKKVIKKVYKEWPKKKKKPNIPVINAKGKNYDKMKNLKKKTSQSIPRRIPMNNGKWTGKRGNSKWVPDKDYIPGGNKPYANPKNKTWGQIMKENKIDGIDFKDGIPDFDKVSKMETKIDYNKIPAKAKEKLLQDKPNRDELHEYFYEKLAKEKNMTVDEIKRFKESKNLVPHETVDGRIQLIPREIHDNIVHEGGVALFRNQLK